MKLPEQELRGVVKSEHVVVILHIIFIEERVELLQLEDRRNILIILIRSKLQQVLVKNSFVR